MRDGFVRIAAATPDIRVADCGYNIRQIRDMAQAAPAGTALMVFPELCVTGATCGDLFWQPVLLKAAEKAVRWLLRETVALAPVLVIGVPVAAGAALYDCALVCRQGRLLGIIPKRTLSAYGGKKGPRPFAAAPAGPQTVTYAGQEACMDADLLFACRQMPEFCFGVEVGEETPAAAAGTAGMAAGGATLMAYMSAVGEAAGCSAWRKNWSMVRSAQLAGAVIYAGAGEGESTSSAVFAGHRLIAENGLLLAEGERFSAGITASEVDVARLLFDRRHNTVSPTPAQPVWFDFPLVDLDLMRPLSPLPFVPAEAARAQRFEEVLTIQSAGLAQRLSVTGGRAVLGLSGGLDSALALLITLRAYDRLGWDHNGIHTVTMPCFGTTGRTKNNAQILAQAGGTTFHEIPIGDAVTRHLEDIGHDGSPDVTYENAQARERTQVLMDLANRVNGLVVGTGDLSELALGWATYNGDHMSMYSVNASVPKTLVRFLVGYEADRIGGDMGEALRDILDTPVSPELLPPRDGEIAQQTEDIVGPYELHDFFLYHMIRFGSSPAKIFRLAGIAFAGRYEDDTIKKWLCTFIRRFFTQQFKRSCAPDGPRVGSVSLSSHGDWLMPSDAMASVWMREAENL